MHVLMMVAAGLALLAVLYGCARIVGRGSPSRWVARASGVFALLWLVVSGINFVVGVSVAGHSVGSEILAHLVIFGVPALAGLWLAIYTSRHDPARPV